MTNQDKNNNNLTPSNQGKINKYSSDLIKKGLDLARSLEKPQETPESWRTTGMDFWCSGSIQEALNCFENAIKLDQNYSSGWNCKGIMLSYLERNEEALISFEKVIEIQPNNHLGWANKGIILGSKFKRHKEAIDNLIKAIELFSQNDKITIDEHQLHIYLYLVGIELQQLKQYKKALRYYNLALEIKKDNVDIWFCKAGVLFIMNENENAIFCCDQALVHLRDNLYYLCENKDFPIFTKDFIDELYQKRKNPILYLRNTIINQINKNKEDFNSLNEENKQIIYSEIFSLANIYANYETAYSTL